MEDINLAKGLPQYVHGLGKLSSFWTIKERRLYIMEQDTDRAIVNLLDTSEQTFKTAYETATRSNQPDNLFKHVLTACALARADESGYFGEQRSYQLRFRHPAMQPYVIMRGIQEGIMDDEAKQALSSPEQGTFFPPCLFFYSSAPLFGQPLCASLTAAPRQYGG